MMSHRNSKVIKKDSNPFAALIVDELSVVNADEKQFSSKRNRRGKKMTLEEFCAKAESDEQTRRKQLAQLNAGKTKNGKIIRKVIIKSGQPTRARTQLPKNSVPNISEMPALCKGIKTQPLTGSWSRGINSIYAAKDIEDPSVVAARQAHVRADLARRLHNLQSRLTNLSYDDSDSDSNSDDGSIYEDEMVTVIGRHGEGEIAEKELTNTVIVGNDNWFDGELTIDQNVVPDNWDEWDDL